MKRFQSKRFHGSSFGLKKKDVLRGKVEFVVSRISFEQKVVLNIFKFLKSICKFPRETFERSQQKSSFVHHSK